jgi:hypothetical protein
MLTNSNTNLKPDHQNINLNSFSNGFGGNGTNDIQIIDNNNSERGSHTSGAKKSLNKNNKDEILMSGGKKLDNID